ncbi:saccharopine dehydrogenase NADP-binding domain-containing protein [Clostridium sp. KNHs205]|uniref:saccharopine dehydrogenase family protein n=1 Tax=Clostridium sp. KNHs205 TaxID=1449050 RepID=UPI00051AAEBE|nr:saccharopine dehydrogenase NADP-binding domain-containing protein [Clostridium sp. KNHs205]
MKEDNLKDKIIVVGGYGHVGQILCKELGELYPGKVYAAGRSYKKAEEFTGKTNNKVFPMQLDTESAAGISQIEEAKVIVMCLDQKNTDFVRLCLNLGIHYVDITANADFHKKIEELRDMAVVNKATALLSVGLTPGISNLLAAKACEDMDESDSVDIAVMLGLGDKHGRAAIEWTIDNMYHNFSIMENGKRTEVKSFTEGKAFDFGEGLGRKKAYRFNFSDQHSLLNTLKVPFIKTRLCFDSDLSTRFFFIMKRTGIFKLLKYKRIYNGMVKLISGFKMGSDKFALKVEASGRKAGNNIKTEVFFSGRIEADMTAKAAAAVTKELYTFDYPYGIFHINELFTIDILPKQVRDKIIFKS